MAFLHGIGLSVSVRPGASGFVEHVHIVEGGLMVDPRARASGLLHEAGHLAIAPTRYRHHLSGDLYKGLQKIMDEVLALKLDPDDPLMRAVLQMSDQEVTAWAWAAGKASGIPDEFIIQDDEYDNDGDSLRIALSLSRYTWINGLSHAGFCVPRKNPYRSLPVYPELAFWLQR